MFEPYSMHACLCWLEVPTCPALLRPCAGLLPPPSARKPMKVVRPTSPPCLRNVLSEDRCGAEDADWNQSLASLPRAQHVASSRFKYCSLRIANIYISSSLSYRVWRKRRM